MPFFNLLRQGLVSTTHNVKVLLHASSQIVNTATKGNLIAQGTSIPLQAALLLAEGTFAVAEFVEGIVFPGTQAVVLTEETFQRESDIGRAMDQLLFGRIEVPELGDVNEEAIELFEEGKKEIEERLIEEAKKAGGL